jgi:hypothetical protein
VSLCGAMAPEERWERGTERSGGDGERDGGGGVPYSSDDKEDMLKEDRERVGHAGGLLFNCAQHGTAQHQYQQSEWQRGPLVEGG